jgi:hypothetical protein
LSGYFKIHIDHHKQFHLDMELSWTE